MLGRIETAVFQLLQSGSTKGTLERQQEIATSVHLRETLRDEIIQAIRDLVRNERLESNSKFQLLSNTVNQVRHRLDLQFGAIRRVRLAVADIAEQKKKTTPRKKPVPAPTKKRKAN